MLVALALYTSTPTPASPPDSAEYRASVRMQTSLTEDQRALPKSSQRLPEAIREYFARPGCGLWDVAPPSCARRRGSCGDPGARDKKTQE